MSEKQLPVIKMGTDLGKLDFTDVKAWVHENSAAAYATNEQDEIQDLELHNIWQDASAYLVWCALAEKRGQIVDPAVVGADFGYKDKPVAQ